MAEELLIPKETEEKRLNDYKRIIENWDCLPEYMAGKLDGIISTYSSIYSRAGKKAG